MRRSTRTTLLLTAAALLAAGCAPAGDQADAAADGSVADTSDPPTGGGPSSSDESSDDEDAREGTATGDALRISMAGGRSAEVVDAAYLDPFREESGREVQITAQGDLGTLLAAAEAGVVEDDVVELDSISAAAALAFGLTQPVSVDPIDPLDELAGSEIGVGYQYYSTLAVWRGGTQPLATVGDLFDPGLDAVRALPDYPTYTLPIALVADGVSPDELYPLDVERAFAVLDAIADDVVLWTSGAEPAQLLTAGEVDHALAWSGRVVDQQGFEFTYDGALLDLAYLTIPAGVDDVAGATELLRAFTDVDRQLEAARGIPYAGGGAELPDLLGDDLAAILPTSDANRDLQFVNDTTWWVENFEDVLAAWEEWKLSL